MRIIGRISFALVAIMLAAVFYCSVSYAGKPAKGGGGTVTPPTPPFNLEITWLGRMSYDASRARDINNHGVVVGLVYNLGASERKPAFVWDPINGMHDLNDLAPISGYTLEWGHAINDSNVIAGWAWNIEEEHWKVFCCKYEPNNRDPNDPSRPLASAWIIPGSVYAGGNLGLNELGDVAFLGQTPGEVIVVKADGSRDTVNAPGATSVEGINVFGEIVVRYNGGSYRYTPGDSPVLLDFPADSYSAINNFGSLCGYYAKKKRGSVSTDDYAVRFQDLQGRFEFGPLTSYANGINDAGDVCGIFRDSSTPQGWNGFLFTPNSAGQWFLWNVSNLIANGGDTKWKTSSNIHLFGINEAKQSCGFVIYRTSVYEETGVFEEAFILTPVP